MAIKTKKVISKSQIQKMVDNGITQYKGVSKNYPLAFKELPNGGIKND